MSSGLDPSYIKEWNSYFYPNTNTLINKFGIIEHDIELQKEAEESFVKLVLLYNNPIIGNFDSLHLKKIHKFLFDSMYDWAGEYRTVFMEKYNDNTNLTSSFSPVSEIEKRLSFELNLMNEDVKKVSSLQDMAILLAEYYIVLLDIHPFREGNGRTIREFLREFVLVKSRDLPMGQVELDWTKVDKDKINEYIELARVFRSNIEMEFLNALVSVGVKKR